MLNVGSLLGFCFGILVFTSSGGLRSSRSVDPALSIMHSLLALFSCEFDAFEERAEAVGVSHEIHWWLGLRMDQVYAPSRCCYALRY